MSQKLYRKKNWYEWIEYFYFFPFIIYTIPSYSDQYNTSTGCQYGPSIGLPLMASPYKTSTDWYWQELLRLYWQASTHEVSSSLYSASTGAVLIASTEPVSGSTGVVPHPLWNSDRAQYWWPVRFKYWLGSDDARISPVLTGTDRQYSASTGMSVLTTCYHSRNVPVLIAKMKIKIFMHFNCINYGNLSLNFCFCLIQNNKIFCLTKKLWLDIPRIYLCLLDKTIFSAG